MALGKNLKRAKLLPDAPVDENIEKLAIEKKKPELKSDSQKPRPVKKEIKKESTPKNKPKKKSIKTSVYEVKKRSKIETDIRPTEEKKLPQANTPKKLSENDKKLRENRRLGYLKELSQLKSVTSTWIAFQVGEEHFAVEIAQALRVIPTPEISLLPHTASYITGVGQLRKRPVIFIDFGSKFNLIDKSNASTDYTYSLIVHAQADLIGILLNQVPHTLKVAGKDLIPIPEAMNLIPKKENYIKFMYKHNGKIIYMLDIEGLILSDQGIQAVSDKQILSTRA